MEWSFDKNGYDFNATDPNGSIYKIINISYAKKLKNLVNWLISDLGFKYQTTWYDKVYRIIPTFGGYGYRVEENQGESVGLVKRKNQKTMEVIVGKTKLEIVEVEANKFLIKESESEIGMVETGGGVMEIFPVKIKLDASKSQVVPLLLFFGALKCQ